MVDFTKRGGRGGGKKPLAPSDIYETLDRASDKGPLRPVQEHVLNEWHVRRRNDKDVIIKLHTGQGKTLIGLLLLQSKLNEGVGPALYLCPDNFLVEQTRLQAAQFGIGIVTADGDLPDDFQNGKRILVTNIHKLFNGLTKFRLKPRSAAVGALVMDDVHACIDSIREACTIQLPSDSQAYAQLVDLFDRDLASQGVGTFADLKAGDYDAILPVPYWAWIDRDIEVAKILAGASSSNDVKFAWPLLKDMLADCDCVVSGASLEIVPRSPPMDVFGSYSDAKHRVFMSATVTDDSFLVKGLGLSDRTIREPLTFPKEKWSGEKMVLMPSVMDEALDRSALVAKFAGEVKDRKFGIVALTPSFRRTTDWGKYGAVVADKKTIALLVQKLRDGERSQTVVAANRYDGIDLPDASCRILVLDSLPYAESVYDRYVERCIGGGEAIDIRVARTIEQGLGRAVRGERDYCVCVLVGPDLVKFVRNAQTRSYLSAQTRAQVEIGMDIAEFGAEEIKGGAEPMKALVGVINQCLRRDEGWKEFYADRMNAVADYPAAQRRLDIFAAELRAERHARNQEWERAVAELQAVADKITDPLERAWFVQEMARHEYRHSKVEAATLQASAYRANRSLLRPAAATEIKKLTLVGHRRIENIADWVRTHENPEQLLLDVESLLADLRFGVSAERFEAAMATLGRVLGFASERPEREWKEGPDNLWCIRDGEYVVIECKSEVDANRADIAKSESDQLNRAAAWFKKVYDSARATHVLVIPPRKLGPSAGFLVEAQILRGRGLEKLCRNVRGLFQEFRGIDLRDLATRRIQEMVNAHTLGSDDILASYTESPVK